MPKIAASLFVPNAVATGTPGAATSNAGSSNNPPPPTTASTHPAIAAAVSRVLSDTASTGGNSAHPTPADQATEWPASPGHRPRDAATTPPPTPTATNTSIEHTNTFSTRQPCHDARRVHRCAWPPSTCCTADPSPTDSSTPTGSPPPSPPSTPTSSPCRKSTATSRRSGNLDLTAIAARALDAPDHRFAAAVVGTPGEQFRPLRHDDDGHGEPCYGIGLISRHPVRSWQVTRLTPAPVRSPVYVPGPGGGLILLRDEPRVVLAAVLDTPHGPLTVAATHLSFVPGWNVRQLRHIVRALRALPAPRILLGDLNLPAGPARRSSPAGDPSAAAPPTPPRNPASNSTTSSPTGTALDRLPPVTAVTTPPSTISDHRPLLVDLG